AARQVALRRVHRALNGSAKGFLSFVKFYLLPKDDWGVLSLLQPDGNENKLYDRQEPFLLVIRPERFAVALRSYCASVIFIPPFYTICAFMSIRPTTWFCPPAPHTAPLDFQRQVVHDRRHVRGIAEAAVGKLHAAGDADEVFVVPAVDARMMSLRVTVLQAKRSEQATTRALRRRKKENPNKEAKTSLFARATDFARVIFQHT
ncbi:MAG: hypothetical protein RR893_14190, partial [Clostridia bacterium]